MLVDAVNYSLDARENTYYGHDWILSRYCGMRRPWPIAGVMQHGWTPYSFYSPRLLPIVGRHVLIPRIAWSLDAVGALPGREASVSRFSKPDVIPIGAPFLYLREAMKSGEPNADMQDPAPNDATLFYPVHSHEQSEVSGSHVELAQFVARELDRRSTVCLYYRDFDDPNVREAYLREGLRVIRHGTNKFDKHWLENQYVEITRHSRICANHMGTSLLYAAALGKEVGIVGPRFSTDEETRRSSSEGVGVGALVQNLRRGASGAEARSMGEEELGGQHLRPPRELARLLGWTVTEQAALMRLSMERVAWIISRRLG